VCVQKMYVSIEDILHIDLYNLALSNQISVHWIALDKTVSQIRGACIFEYESNTDSII